MRKFLTFLVGMSMMFAFVGVVGAAPDIGLKGSGTGGSKGGLANEIGKKSGFDTVVSDESLSKSVGQIIKVVLSMIGTIFFALTVYAGFLWMTASGNEEQVTKAQSIIKMAIIGLVIVLASYTITTFVVARTVGATKSDLSVPE